MILKSTVQKMQLCEIYVFIIFLYEQKLKIMLKHIMFVAKVNIYVL